MKQEEDIRDIKLEEMETYQDIRMAYRQRDNFAPPVVPVMDSAEYGYRYYLEGKRLYVYIGR